MDTFNNQQVNQPLRMPCLQIAFSYIRPTPVSKILTITPFRLFLLETYLTRPAPESGPGAGGNTLIASGRGAVLVAAYCSGAADTSTCKDLVHEIFGR